MQIRDGFAQDADVIAVAFRHVQQQGMKSIPVNLVHANRVAVLEVCAGAFQFGMFHWGEFREIWIPCEDKAAQKFVGEALFYFGTLVAHSQAVLFRSTGVLHS